MSTYSLFVKILTSVVNAYDDMRMFNTPFHYFDYHLSSPDRGNVLLSVRYPDKFNVIKVYSDSATEEDVMQVLDVISEARTHIENKIAQRAKEHPKFY